MKHRGLIIMPPWSDDNIAQMLRQMDCPSIECYSTESELTGSIAITPSLYEDSIGLTFETSGDKTIQFLKDVGLEPLELGDKLAQHIKQLCEDLNPLLSEQLGLLSCIEQIVGGIVPIKSSGEGYDCSYSTPEIASSIFVSIPNLSGTLPALRFGESIVHEAMHLLLTFFEKKHPLVKQSGEKMVWYSPWREEPRKLRGVLHGMYVFYIIRLWYVNLLQGDAIVCENIRSFIRRRVDTINSELLLLHGFEGCSGLSGVGKDLVCRILSHQSSSTKVCGE